MKIAPSMLASKPENYVKDAQILEKANVEWFHIDMLDGTFTNTHAFPVEDLKIINNATDFPMDIHLMTNHPIESLPEYIEAGGDMLTAHVEAVNPRKYIDAVKKYDKMVGLAVNPDTPLSSIVDYIGELDRILIMTVVPGKTGQSFIEAPLSKVKEARQLIDKHNYDVELCVDGGINEKTAPLAIEAGVDVVVCGAGILYKDDMIKAVEDLRALASK
ncbi:MAG: ribulose-phosphate 3-epimerase [Nitrososphaerales archaeon]|nr:ribulose-phosphate 3-epimerase [Nitrososphaerales archaeon]|tara:strand:- start:2253 stop:2903 length:651 start_codon:yes stop_codon:yes gene_type:complete